MRKLPPSSDLLALPRAQSPVDSSAHMGMVKAHFPSDVESNILFHAKI